MVECLLMVEWVIGSIPHGAISPSKQCSKTVHGVCCLVCRMVYVKYPMLLIKKSSPCSVVI